MLADISVVIWSLWLLRLVNRPIAAHFHSADLKFAYFREDLCEAVCEPVESRADVVFLGDRATKNQHEMLGDKQGIDEAIATCTQRCG